VRTVLPLLAALSAVPAVSQVVVVDDGSTDGTREALTKAEAAGSYALVLHDRNRGKGAAIRTGLARASGEVVVVQDADLEYDPHELPRLLAEIQAGADVVYGSRYLNRPDSPAWHTFGNRILTFLSNLLLGLHLTDMETCYKMMRTDLLRSVPLRCDGFGFEPEVTAALAIRGIGIREVPIRYRHRSYSDGKKIGWKDAFRSLAILIQRSLTR
jgi:glycosyltransferase involved in cell wall biosynthesis